jgi:phosphatidylserine/phosphatidylglycerophosphate/cardiolipin synthase-like enzyme
LPHRSARISPAKRSLILNLYILKKNHHGRQIGKGLKDF